MQLIKWTTRLMGLAALAFAGGFLLFVYSIQREAPQVSVEADGIVVLTGGTERIARGLKLLADKRAKRLLISGVNRKTTRKTLANQTPARSHLFRCCIDIGYEAQDTIGNASETRQWVLDNKFNSLIVVTSSYHMPRSLAELHQALPGVVLHPYPVVPSTVHAQDWYANPGTARLLLWEYIKFLPAATRYCVARVLATGQSVHAVHADTLSSS